MAFSPLSRSQARIFSDRFRVDDFLGFSLSRGFSFTGVLHLCVNSLVNLKYSR
jgi:hypothetical protein